MNNPIVKYGLFYGASLLIGFYASHLILGTGSENFDSSEVIGYSLMIVCSVFVLLGMVACKKQQGSSITFRSALWAGIRITAIASAMFAAYNWVYLKFINPEFTEVYIAYSKEKILSSGLSEDVIQEQLAELAYYADLMSSNLLQSLLMFITVFLIGLLCSLVGAAAIRSR